MDAEMVYRSTVVVCLLGSVIAGPRHIDSRTNEQALLKYLFTGYNPSARPVLNSSLTVNVNLRFSLLQIQELNVRSQVLTTTGLLILDWIDERLTWNESISELDEIVVHSVNIWRPEFAVINGAESIYGEYTEFQAVLRRNGRIRWEPGGVFRTMCPIDIKYYPFDEQICQLQFGAWSYYTTKMNLTTDRPDGTHLDNYEKNSEWEITGRNGQRHEFAFECCPNERFSYIAFSLSLRRRHEFYVMNVVLPGLLTSVALLSIFYCIPSQKVHIGVAALLSFRLFLVNVADTIPRTSDHVPVLGIYLTCTMAITTLAMVATVFVGNLYELKDRPVPPWVRSVLLHYAARLLGYCTQCVDAPPGFQPVSSPSVTHSDSEHSRCQHRDSYRLVTLLEDAKCQPSVGRNDNNGVGSTVDMVVYKSPLSAVKVVVKSVVNPVRHARSYSRDWACVGAVCDRLFFWFCLLLTLVTTGLLFHPLLVHRS